MIDVVVRTVFVYVLIIFSVRLMGKRQIGELQPSDLVTTILISNLASLAVEETDLPIVSAVIPILLIVALEIIVSILAVKFPAFSRGLAGSNKVVIKNGVIDQKMLDQLRFSTDDLLEALRNKDVFDVRDVAYAVVETNGVLNLVKISQSGAGGSKKGNVLLPVVIDGKIDFQSLDFLNLSEQWLCDQIENSNTTLKNVLLLQCDTEKNYFIVEREKQ